MSISDVQRRDLHAALEQALGAGPAAVMMELLPPMGWSDVARQSSVDAQFVALRGEMAELRGELRGEFGELRGEFGELRGEFGELRGEVASLKGDWKRLAAINAVTVLASSMTTAGLVLAAARLAS